MFAPAVKDDRDAGGVTFGSTADPVWTPSDSYNRDHFYIRTAKRNEPTDRAHIRLSPDVAAQIVHEIQAGRWPYRTTSDFHRDAAIHRLHDLSRMIDDPALTRFSLAQRNLAQAEQLKAEMDRLIELLAHWEEAAEMAVKHDDWLALAGLLRQGWDAADEIRDPYATRLRGKLRDFQTRFPEGYRENRPGENDRDTYERPVWDGTKGATEGTVDRSE
jgi:hypothetical protein